MIYVHRREGSISREKNQKKTELLRSLKG